MCKDSLCGYSLSVNRTGQGGLTDFVRVFSCPGTSEGSTGNGSGFQASEKTGHSFKSYPTDLESRESIVVPSTPEADIHQSQSRVSPQSSAY